MTLLDLILDAFVVAVLVGLFRVRPAGGDEMNADYRTVSIRKRGRFSIELGKGRFITVMSKRHNYGRWTANHDAEASEKRALLAAEDEALRDRIYRLLKDGL